MQVANCTCSEL